MSQASERTFLAEALCAALEAMGLRRDGEALTYSTFGDSVGAQVRGDSFTLARWLRVYPQWDRENERQGWATSVAIPGVAKPTWYRCHDFEHGGKAMRGDLLSLAPSSACTSQLVLTSRPPIGAEWFAEMRRSVDALACWPTERAASTQDAVTRRALSRMGSYFPAKVERWVTSHADMHWCNITAPVFCLLDWDSWGLAPYGFGPATAYCSALLVPDVADAIFETFRDQLETNDGRISLMIAASHLLDMVGQGYYPEIPDVLHEILRGLRCGQEGVRSGTEAR